MTVRCGPCPSLAAVSGPQQDRLIECQHRRAVLLNIALITALGAAPMQADAGQQVSPDLVPYASPGQYSMLVPVTWKQVGDMSLGAWGCAGQTLPCASQTRSI